MDKVTLNMRDQQRHTALVGLVAGLQTAGEAAKVLELSVRQTRRLLARFREVGLAGIPHGNRGRPPVHALSEAFRELVASTIREDYKEFNNHHAQELLAEEHQIHLSVSSLRRIRRADGCPSPRKRRAPKPHPMRERKPQAGMMLLLDASKHHWFGPDLPASHLLAAIDDATGEVFLVFRQEEDTIGYLLLLERICRTRGVPLVLYTDRRTLFGPPVTGKPARLDSHFARIARELSIHHSFAGSPQAKGRVERLFGTLQGRLVPLLVKRQVRSIDQANAILPGLVQRHNRSRAIEPASPEPAYRKPPKAADLRRILALQFPRVVANDNTISFGGKRLLIRPTTPTSYAHKRVTFCVQPNGTTSFWIGNERIARGPTVPPVTSVLPSRIAADLPGYQPTPAPARPKPRTRREPTGVRPADNHPWKHRFPSPKPDGTVQSTQSPGGQGNAGERPERRATATRQSAPANTAGAGSPASRLPEALCAKLGLPNRKQ